MIYLTTSDLYRQFLAKGKPKRVPRKRQPQKDRDCRVCDLPQRDPSKVFAVEVDEERAYRMLLLRDPWAAADLDSTDSCAGRHHPSQVHLAAPVNQGIDYSLDTNSIHLEARLLRY